MEENSKKIGNILEFQKEIHEIVIKKSLIHKAREKYQTKYKKEFFKSYGGVKKNPKHVCDLKFLICFNFIEKYKNSNKKWHNFIFRQANPPIMIYDHVPKYITEKKNE